MKKSKVFIGFRNTANISVTLAAALQKSKIFANYVSLKYTNSFYNYKKGKIVFQFAPNTFPVIFKKNVNSLINTFILHLYFIIYLFKYNTFIFISPDSFLPNNIDLPILKFLKKKIIYVFAGCAERDINFKPDNPEYICNRCNDEDKKFSSFCYDIKRKQRNVQKLEFYSDYVLAQDDSASYLKQKKAIWFYVMSEYPKGLNYIQKFQNKRIKIVHFPSNPKIKLSHLIIPVLEQIKIENFNIDIIIESGISHDKVIQYLSESHILVDALGLGYGVLAVEAMSHGCIVVTGEMDFIENTMSNNPILKSSSKTLYRDLIELISNKQRMIDLAQASMIYFNKYHSFLAAGAYYKDKLNLK